MKQETATTAMEPVVSVSGLCRRFGMRDALDGVSLKLPAGCVYGLVGGNGAGKTTLIRHLLGLLRAQKGVVRVFGMDPVRQPDRVLVRVGYLSEDRDLPEWMRVGELMRYTAAFHPSWDPAYAEELRATLRPGPRPPACASCRADRRRWPGCCARSRTAPRSCCSTSRLPGLDAVVRRQILAAIIRTVADEGRTVLFSSHLLDEVERVADRVAMIHAGRVVLEGPLEEIRARAQRGHHRVRAPPDPSLRLPGVLQADASGTEWTALCNGNRAALDAALAGCGGSVVAERSPSLEDIFVARAGVPSAAPREE